MEKPRPYRSRRIPACARCRARRSKCTVEVVGKSCLLCQLTGAECSAATLLATSLRRRFESLEQSPISSKLADVHVVSPMVARDTQVLEGLLPSTHSAVMSTAQKKSQHQPVYHVTVPPRRPSPTPCGCSRDLYMKFMQQIEPYLERLIDLYSAKLQPCFPIVDVQSLRPQLGKGREFSRALSATFAAYMLFHWNRSVERSRTIDVDQDFAWQVACIEIKAEGQTNDLFSIVSTVLSVAGRPSTSLIHNATNVARNVALSNSVGLNYDCSSWQILGNDKEMRQRLWWTVLIHDRWFHFAQGTPPLINPLHYDVALPDVSLLIGAHVGTSHMGARSRSSQCFVALCELTEIVGETLPLIYEIRSGNANQNAEKILKSQSDLESWQRNLPGDLLFGDHGRRSSFPGLANLQLSYLATRMLLTRLEWYKKSQADDAKDEVLLNSCQMAAQAITSFVIGLEPRELFGFWLPYNAQHFISSVTLLLRCALQTRYIATREKCIESVREFVECLQTCQAMYGWDMAEMALPQCQTILRRIEDALPKLRATEIQGAIEDDSMDKEHERGGMATNDDTSSVSQCFDTVYQASLEELFPEMFSAFGDCA